jgi:TPR repeat protein
VPINDFADENMELAKYGIEQNYTCWGGCAYSFIQSGHVGTCPYCKADQSSVQTNEERVGQIIMKRVEANDACAMFVLGNEYMQGGGGLLQDRERALELWKQAAKLGYSLIAHFQLGVYYHDRGNSKKEKFPL